MKVKDLAKISIIAALYIILTVVLGFEVASGPIQFRIAEVLVLLAFYNKNYIYGITLGCLISNIYLSGNPYDIIFGTFHSFISLLFIYLTRKKLGKNNKSLFISSLYPTIFSFIVGFALYKGFDYPFIITTLQVMLSEFIIVTLIGFPLFLILNRNKEFIRIIEE